MTENVSEFDLYQTSEFQKYYLLFLFHAVYMGDGGFFLKGPNR
jgi:hypothetical protein